MTVFHASCSGTELRKAAVLAVLLCKAGTCTGGWKAHVSSHRASSVLTATEMIWRADQPKSWQFADLTFIAVAHCSGRWCTSLPEQTRGWKEAGLLSKKIHRGQPKCIPGGKLLTNQLVLKNTNKVATLGNLSWNFSYEKGRKNTKRGVGKK